MSGFMKTNRPELSDSVFMDCFGRLQMYYTLGGFVGGVFEWDDQLDFFLILHIG